MISFDEFNIASERRLLPAESIILGESSFNLDNLLYATISPFLTESAIAKLSCDLSLSNEG